MMKGGYDLLTFINLLFVMNCYNFVYLYCIDENNVEAFSESLSPKSPISIMPQGVTIERLRPYRRGL